MELLLWKINFFHVVWSQNTRSTRTPKKKGEEEEERRPENTNQQHQKNFLIKKQIENRKKSFYSKIEDD